MGEFRAAEEEPSISSLSPLALRGFGAQRGGDPPYEGGYYFDRRRCPMHECRPITHAGESEACISVHWCGVADLQRGRWKIHCFAQGGGTDSGRGSVDALNVGCVPTGWAAQAGGHVPFMGTNGGDPSFREFPYSIGRRHMGRPQCPIVSARAGLGLSTTEAPAAGKARDSGSVPEFRENARRAGRPAEITSLEASS